MKRVSDGVVTSYDDLVNNPYDGGERFRLRTSIQGKRVEDVA